MAKLHELLAVESNLKSQAVKSTADLLNTFEKKKHHFGETLVTFIPNEEGKPESTESQLDLQTTVKKEIAWLSPFLVKAIDAGFQVDVANTFAKADVVLDDGYTVIADVPATSLLQLEKRINELHTFVTQIPTLDPAKGFEPDSQRGDGIFRARDITKPRTKKVNKILTLAPATEKHPAQVQVIVEDEPIGTLKQQEWSGLITTADKGKMIERVETLLRAVKQARARANDIDLDTTKNKIGKRLLDYVFAS